MWRISARSSATPIGARAGIGLVETILVVGSDVAVLRREAHAGVISPDGGQGAEMTSHTESIDHEHCPDDGCEITTATSTMCTATSATASRRCTPTTRARTLRETAARRSPMAITWTTSTAATGTSSMATTSTSTDGGGDRRLHQRS